MTKSALHAVMTTIQPPAPAVGLLTERLAESGSRLWVIGDVKGPASYPLDGCDLVTLAEQLELDWPLARLLPTGHYSRKNLGYLLAIAAGAGTIYETDDDNAPLAGWGPRSERIRAAVVGSTGWINIFRAFSGARIWPRGYPLDAVIGSMAVSPVGDGQPLVEVDAPIQQGLVNGSPDVDAVWRLVLDAPFTFDDGPSVYLGEGAWCPFNSQSTWWWPRAYPLLYLPSHCSFRMTDIWRSLVAQRCLWAMGAGIAFHAAEAFQERNPHDLMRDFEDEVPGYTGNRRLVAVLEALPLEGGDDGVLGNLRHCYRALVREGFFPEDELGLVEAWCDALCLDPGAT